MGAAPLTPPPPSLTQKLQLELEKLRAEHEALRAEERAKAARLQELT